MSKEELEKIFTEYKEKKKIEEIEWKVARERVIEKIERLVKLYPKIKKYIKENKI